jgi:murein L,D-transpeptidase YafK
LAAADDSNSDIYLLIEKAARRLTLFREGRLALRYPVILGRNAETDKQIEGDQATPLGEYYVCAKNPRSKFYLSLCLSYPNLEDAARGLKNGLISQEEHEQIAAAITKRTLPPQRTRLGGEIYIHGFGDRTPLATRGCIAVDNAAMQEIYAATVIGTRVVIVA